MASCFCDIPREEAEGRRAFRAGFPDSVCPHVSIGCGMNVARTRWMNGYYSERVERFLKKIERKYSTKVATPTREEYSNDR